MSGHTTAWPALLDRLIPELAGTRRLLPGHGAPAGVDLLAEQRRYVMHYREVVRRLSNGSDHLDDAAKAELETTMRRFLPDSPLTWMIILGADAVAAELAG